MKNNFKWLLVIGAISAFACKKGGDNGTATTLEVATKAATEITAFVAQSGGSISGTMSISERGICWGTAENPTKSDSFIADVDQVMGDYTLKMSDLVPQTTYYVRAYAVSASGDIVYGEQVSFQTAALQQSEESNSYLVSSDATLVIPVSRANESDLGTRIAENDILTAELLWMDNLDVIDQVFTYGSGPTGSVVVVAGNTSGNAVVAVKVDNAVKWSWHVWVSANAASVSTITMPSGALLMDRNLGATTKTISEIGAVGVQFQFGRKDPFTASASFGTPSEVLLYDLSGNNPEIGKVTGPKDLAYVTDNPFVFVNSQWVDWCDETVDTWWANDEGVKTVYDPCPDGWRVPSLADYADISEADFDTDMKGGYNFIYNGQSNYFPFTGYRECPDGIMDATANYGTMWVNAPIGGDAGIASALSPSYGIGGVQPVNGAPRSRGLSIRCIKE